MSRISFVVAMDLARGIGRDNGLMWSLPDDLKHFKRLTVGKPVVMGRKTYESIGRPLPHRPNVIVSRNPDFHAPGCTVVTTLDQAIQLLSNEHQEVMIIGGAAIFEQTLAQVDTIYLTEVHATLPADTFFPPLSPEEWRETERSEHPADDRHAYAYTFRTLERA